MGSEFYAHSREGKPPEEWQKLDEHLRAVSAKARDFASSFQSSEWAWNAGWLHDLGKATNAFQSYLLRSNGLDDSEYDADGSESNHASAGAAFAEDILGPMIGRTLAYLAAGHHAGLPDWFACDTGNAALEIRLEEGRSNLSRIRSVVNELRQNLRALTKPPPFVKPPNYHLWVRMLFSCLVDADYLDTQAFMDGGKAAQLSASPNVGELAGVFFQALEDKERNADPTPVNAIRSEIRRACEAAAEHPTGLFSLTVPTGGGKTLSGTAFALKHAIKRGKDRVIYVIPYTTIVEQTAGCLADILGAENVVEHHSNLSPEKETHRSKLAAENWDAPVIVTTNVQFFESLYAAKPGRCRKLHNIANSVVILDEAQLIPPELLHPCVQAINELTRNYGVTVLLSTATQPALPGLDTPREIIRDHNTLYEQLKRTEIILPDDLQTPTDWDDLAQQLREHEQVLCVVNTRRDCYDLFKKMPEDAIHLSALMCGAHRSEVIVRIKQRLEAKEPCRVISTQLVEAGVDVDFPVVYRALAGLDSIAQVAGRCNREGKLDGLGQVHVFVPPKAAPRGILLKGESKARELLGLPNFDPQAPASFTRYFELFYASVNDHGKKWVHDRLVKDIGATQACVQFRTAGNEFRMIDDQAQRPVFVCFGDSGKRLDELRKIGPKRENMRRLQRYVVNLSKRAFERAREDGLLEEVWPEFWCWARRYDPVIGVDPFGGGWSPEDLAV
ncbi:MAG: CRISPR-associated helicase Cas3' [Verrucomicrobiota bacterium]